MRKGKGFHLTITAIDGSGGRIIHEWPRTLFHPQFHPRIPDLIEYSSDPAPRMRMIRADGSDDRLLWDHGNDQFLVHETYLGDGDDLIVVRWPHALQRFSLKTGGMSEIARFNAWHISPTRDGRYVACDTNHPDIGIQIVEVASGRRKELCRPESSNGGDQWRHDYYFEPDKAPNRGDDQSLSWLERKTDTIYGPQWTHPHPSWGRDDDKVVFTSDRTGSPQVYVAEIPDGFLEFAANER